MTISKNFTLSTKHQLLILLFLAVGLNINTLFNQYAFDDEMVLIGNTVVQKGIHGIPEILSHDYYYGIKEIDQTGLSGGRYRPLVLVIFALEYQFFGANPMVSHLINILFFALLITLLYKLLQTYVFKEQNKYLAFVTCLIFAVHPIHTEVIANVKSRDEIISFILLIVSLISFIKHLEKRSLGHFLNGLFCFLLALLTRESAAAFVVVIPLIFYFFFSQTIKKLILFSLPLIGVFIGYLLLRFSIIGYKTYGASEILNAPFLYADASQAIATKVFLLIKYIWLLVFPYPLSSDYSYNQIPYIELNSIKFIFSILLLFGLSAFAVLKFKSRSIYSFSIIYFMVTIFLLANFAVNIGAPLAERFLFQPSLAFCIVASGLYISMASRFKFLANSILIIILLLFSVKTVLRNSDWKNNETLFLTDVISAPNSVKLNLYAAKCSITKAQTEANRELRDEYFRNAVNFDERLLKIYPNYSSIDIYKDLGAAYLGLNDYFKAADLWLLAYKSDAAFSGQINGLSDIIFNEGNKFYKKGNTDAAIKCYRKSLELNFNNIDAWHNLSKSYSFINDKTNAIAAWQNVILLDDKHQFSNEGYNK